MKKLSFSVLLFAFCLASVFAISINHADEVHSFDSVPMLNRYFDMTDDGNDDYWDSYTISLLTISQGGPLYSWFGHSAFLVQTPTGRNIAFDYGTFSFSSDDFIKNFIMGRLWFVCLSSYADLRMAELEDDGRNATTVVLPLTPAQKKAIVRFMDENTSHENRDYLYHHYKDNCATRLRDIIDRATVGDFKKWAQSQRGYTFRQQASRALSRNRFIQWGLEFLQSSMIDKEATLWDEMFLPDVLEKAVMEYFGLKSTVVVDNGSLYPSVPDKPQSNILFSALFGLILGGISVLLWYLGFDRANGIYRGIVCIIFGILGSVLFFMMCFTNHDVTWFNENIVFVNPLLLVLGILSFFKNERVVRLCRICFRILVGLILMLIILKVIASRFFFQQNWSAIITMALLYIPNTFKSRKSES